MIYLFLYIYFFIDILVLAVGSKSSQNNYGFLVNNTNEDYFDTPTGLNSKDIENLAERVAERIKRGKKYHSFYKLNFLYSIYIYKYI